MQLYERAVYEKVHILSHTRMHSALREYLLTKYFDFSSFVLHYDKVKLIPGMHSIVKSL